MIVTVTLSSLRYARIRDGRTRIVPGGQSQIDDAVLAWNVLKRDQRVIGFRDGVMDETPAPRSG